MDPRPKIKMRRKGERLQAFAEENRTKPSGTVTFSEIDGNR